MKKKCIVILLLCLIPIYSCTIYREYAIEVFQPEQVLISPNTQNVVLLSRNFKYAGDSLTISYKSDYALKSDRKLTEKEIDSIVYTGCLDGFVSKTKEDKVFKKITVLPLDLVKKHYGEKIIPLNWALIEKLTSSTNSDLLISLETFSALYSELTYSYTSSPSNEVVTVAVWTVYDPHLKKEIDHKSMIDTVFWNGTDESGKPEKLPARETALSVASKLAGQNYAKRFSSSWVKVYRMYGIPPVEDFRLAANAFEEGKWTEAMDLWGKYTSGKNGRLAIIARYNMALASEMNDDIDTALEWIKKATEQAVIFKSKEDIKSAILYKNILLKRKNEIQLINQKKKAE